MLIRKGIIVRGVIAPNNEPRKMVNNYILSSNFAFDLQIKFLQEQGLISFFFRIYLRAEWSMYTVMLPLRRYV